jgi:anti-sigma regulatory factor (Ser/Thr protein kinase)
MNPREILIEVAADPRLLGILRGMVRSYLAEVGFERERTDEVVLGVDEACSNAIRHGCQGCEDQTFQICFRSDDEWVEIQLVDSGTPAPPDAFDRRPRTPPADVDSVTPGGLGVHLIHEVFDEVLFNSGPGTGNCLTMRLKRPKHAGRTGLRGEA